MSQVDATTGWTAAGLFGVAIAASPVNRWRVANGRSFSMGLFRSHNWLGGIWAGAAAVGLLVLTAFAGSGLSGAKPEARRRIHRNHVATMFAVLAAGIVHTALNGPLAGR